MATSLLLFSIMLVMVVSHVVQLWTLAIPSSLFKSLHLCIAIIMLGLVALNRRESLWASVFGALMALIATVCLVYIFVSFEALITDRMFGPSTTDLVVGILLLVAAISAAKQVWGWIIPVIAVGTLLYGYLGPYLPGELFYHSGVKFERLISYTSIPFFEGLLGSMTGLSAGLIFAFMLFAGLLKSTGGIEFILTLAARLGGRTRGGPAQVAVLGSGVMGMISGSTVANVASTGTITIPLMKKHGFPAHHAGAIEAVASTGGQFMPPVMGLTAFLIVGITGVPYGSVMLASLLPAIIYYLNLLIAVHFHAVSADMESGFSMVSEEEPPSIAAEVARYGHLVVAICLLVVLLVSRMPPAHAAVLTCLFIVVTESAKQLIVHRGAIGEGFKVAANRIFAGLCQGAKDGAQLAVVIAVIGVLVDMLTVTGFAQKLSNLILDFADENLFTLLALAAMSCLVFGLGMPTPAAYSLVAVVGAPALVDFGVDVLAAHMFVFFFANMSAITPPVALAALVAAKVSQASYSKTAIKASCLGLPGFILPFLFVFNPELLMLDGSVAESILTFVLTLLGFVALNIGLSGTLFRLKLSVQLRLASLGAAVLLVTPSIIAKVSGLVLLICICALDYSRRSTSYDA